MTEYCGLISISCPAKKTKPSPCRPLPLCPHKDGKGDANLIGWVLGRALSVYLHG